MRHSFTASSMLVAPIIIGIMALAGCGKPPAPPPPPPPPEPPVPTTEQTATAGSGSEELGQPSDPRFIGKIWVSTTPGHSRGTLMIFLPNRTLLMTSCFETYRISKWGVAGDRIRWIEDAIPIEAVISLASDNDLRLQLAGQDKVQTYVAATEPYVCPDMR